ncbi:MAG: hypothetical protein RL563_2069, partial [Pseudomonadota bacterium]
MLLVAVLTPFLAVSIQWYFWDILNPLTWILLYPAVFFSASVGGLRGGALATLITVLLADFFFIPPSFTFYIENDRNLYSAIIFFLMGVLFSLVFEKLHKTLDEVHRLSKLELDRYINRLDQALAFADAGIWEWDVRSGEVFWSNSLWELYGLEANSCQATYENWLKSVALDDREPIQLAIQKAVAEKAEILLEWRVHSSLDQQTHYLMSRGQPELDDTGRLERYRGIVIDITARKLMEESLKTSESRLRLCQDSGGIGSWEANFIDDTQVWSQSCYKLLGVPENISLNWQGFLDLVHPDDRQLIINAVALHIHNGDKYEVDYRLDSSTNDFRWMRSVGQAERSAEGQLTIFRGIVQDITEQKKAELALKHSEAEFKLLAEAMPQIVWITRADGCNTFFNQQWFDYTGLTWEDSIGTNWTKPFHPDDRQRAWDAWQHAIQEHLVYALEARLKKYDGSYRWWLIRGVPVTNEQGEIRNWFGTCTDIDDIKATQAALSSAEKRWSFALEGSGQGVWDWDVATNRMNYSPLWKSILGYADQEFPNDLQAWLDRIHPDDHESVVGALDALTKGKTLQFDQEYRLRHRNNEYIWVSVRGMVFDVNTESLPMRLLGIQQNIHQRKLQDLELQQYHDHLEQLVSERTDALNEARERAEKLAEVKSAFLANMSHEIRTPMNAVLGFCYLLEQKSLDSDSRDLVVKIHNAGRNLLNIINDILDFSKIEAGRIDMESTPFHLHTLLEHVGAMMQSLAGSKRLELIISPPEEISGLIGDEQRLQQVLINLVGNAIKFTDDGEVSLLVTCEQAHDHDVRLRFSVKDTGIGMSEEQLTKLFQAFSQADASIGRRFGGTGLGLAISQRLIALMGGELQVNSHLDQGSEFWFV